MKAPQLASGGGEQEVHQAVRIPPDLPFDLVIGKRVDLVCWGVMPSGMLRPPVLRVLSPAISCHR